jgi:hypothetical protein
MIWKWKLSFSGVRVTRSLVLYVCFPDRCLSFVLSLLAIVLSVLRYTVYDCPFGIYKRSGRINSSCSTSGTRRANLVTNPVISYEWGKDQEVVTTSGTYPWSFVTQIFHNGQPSHGGDRKTFEVMTVNFQFICCNIPAALAYGVYISQLIRYSRTCGSFRDILDREFLLTSKLLNSRVHIA